MGLSAKCIPIAKLADSILVLMMGCQVPRASCAWRDEPLLRTAWPAPVTLVAALCSHQGGRDRDQTDTPGLLDSEHCGTGSQSGSSRPSGRYTLGPAGSSYDTCG